MLSVDQVVYTTSRGSGSLAISQSRIFEPKCGIFELRAGSNDMQCLLFIAGQSIRRASLPSKV